MKYKGAFFLSIIIILFLSSTVSFSASTKDIIKCYSIKNTGARVKCYDRFAIKLLNDKKNSAQPYVFSNVSYRQRSYGVATDFIGEITNNTNKFQSYVTFDILVYSANKKLIGKGFSIISNLTSNQTKAFTITVFDVPASEIKTYKFQMR